VPLFLQNTTGSVGVNTQTPEFTLDVNGTGRFAGDVVAGANATGRIVFGTSRSSSGYNICVENWQGTADWVLSENNVSRRIILRPGGRLEVNTAQLAVNGPASFTGDVTAKRILISTPALLPADYTFSGFNVTVNGNPGPTVRGVCDGVRTTISLYGYVEPTYFTKSGSGTITLRLPAGYITIYSRDSGGTYLLRTENGGYGVSNWTVTSDSNGGYMTLFYNFGQNFPDGFKFTWASFTATWLV